MRDIFVLWGLILVFCVICSLSFTGFDLSLVFEAIRRCGYICFRRYLTTVTTCLFPPLPTRDGEEEENQFFMLSIDTLLGLVLSHHYSTCKGRRYYTSSATAAACNATLYYCSIGSQRRRRCACGPPTSLWVMYYLMHCHHGDHPRDIWIAVCVYRWELYKVLTM